MFVVLFAGLLVLAGLLVDASRVLLANADASDLAAKAARVGAQEIDLTSLRTGTSVGAGIGTGASVGAASGRGTGNGTAGGADRGPDTAAGGVSGVVLDRAAAEAAARDYLDRHGIDGTAAATGTTVTVTIRLHVPYTLRALSGRAGETVVQTRSAVATRGP